MANFGLKLISLLVRDMHDCFQNNEPVIIDGVKYTIKKMESRSGGLAGAFLLEKS